ncbi:MAG: hypothetical protein MUF15_12575, partial [Acidobacteria bacterium]|nr:hypothetical protein [Acidobacteriota bacterium]
NDDRKFIMGKTTFSGPIRAGTVRDGLVTTKNIGTTILAQTATVPFGSITTSPSAVNLFTLPAGAKITNFSFETVTAITGGSVSAVAAVVGRPLRHLRPNLYNRFIGKLEFLVYYYMILLIFPL